MRILYISNTSRTYAPIIDPSVRYRCFNFARELSNNPQHLVDVVAFSNFDPHQLTYNYDVAIFHKPRYSIKLKQAIKILKNLNKKYFADYDDFIFNAKYLKETSIYKNNVLPKENIRLILESNQNAINLFENFIVSTDFLAEKIKELNKSAKVLVLYNSISQKWLDIAKYYHRSKSKRNNIKVIGYFCGTLSHNLDFKLIENRLYNFLNKCKNVRLKILGPLSFSTILKDKVEAMPVVPFMEMPKHIADCDVTIAPLENTIFNNSKSSIKFLESMSVGTPCVVSPIPDMKRHVNNGVVLSELNNWELMLEKCLFDQKFINEKKHQFNKNINKLMISNEIKKLEKIL